MGDDNSPDFGATAFPPHSQASQTLIDMAGATSDTTHYHQKVAQRIRELEHEIQQLQVAHNTATGTCRFPPEILSQIFLLANSAHCSSSSSDAGSDKNNFSGTQVGRNCLKTPIRVSHVCQRWRDVALGCPALWTCLHFAGPNLTMLADLVVDRSRPMPLDVTYYQDLSPPLPNLLAMLSTQPPRLRSFALAWSHRDEPDSHPSMHGLLDWTTKPSLALEELRIRVYEGYRLPDGFLSRGDFPRLRTLALDRCSVSWDQLPLAAVGSTLTTLDLMGSNHAGQDARRPESLKVFLGTLVQMHHLESLSLAFFCPRPPATGSPRAVLLPSSLRSVSVLDWTECVDTFFRFTRCPTATNVSAGYDRNHGPATIEQSLGYVVGSWIPGGGRSLPLDVRELRLERGQCHFDFAGSSKDPIGSSPKGIYGGMLTVSFAGPNFPYIPMFVHAVQGKFNLEALESLHILSIDSNVNWRTRPLMCKHLWRIFVDLPNVRSLTLDNLELHAFVRTLTESGLNTTGFVNRALQNITVRWFSLDYADGDERRFYQDNYYDDILVEERTGESWSCFTEEFVPLLERLAVDRRNEAKVPHGLLTGSSSGQGLEVCVDRQGGDAAGPGSEFDSGSWVRKLGGCGVGVVWKGEARSGPEEGWGQDVSSDEDRGWDEDDGEEEWEW